MPDGQVLEFAGVTKQFGTVTAVSGLSARIEPGLVTGFLGPNGAGKTTTLRILLGLVRATAGSATIGGVPYAKLRAPLQSVGAVLEASSFHPGRTAANHLKIYAQAAGLPVARVDEVLGTVGLAGVGGSKVGGFSLGMKQRLSLAYALLGDPGVLILDEPSNGLDPEGIIWMRSLLRELARQGRTVLVSSHLLAEVQQTVDALLIIAQGRLVFQGGLDELTDPGEFVTVVDAPDRVALSAALGGAAAEFEVLRSGLTVRGASAAEVGTIAASAGVGLSLLQRRGPGLEDVFLDLVNGVRVHPSASAAVSVARPIIDDGSDTAPPPDSVDGSVIRPEGSDPDSGPDPTAAAEPVEEQPTRPAGAGADADSDSDSTSVPEPVEEPPTPPAGTDADSGPDELATPPARPADAGSDAEPDAGAPAEPAARPAFAVAGTGVIDIVDADSADGDDADRPADGPDFFEPTDSVTEPAPGAADDDADPSTDDIIVPASEDPTVDSEAVSGESETDLENKARPAAQRWEAQFDPVVTTDTDDEVSDSDAAADEFFGASDTRDEGGRR